MLHRLSIEKRKYKEEGMKKKKKEEKEEKYFHIPYAKQLIVYLT